MRKYQPTSTSFIHRVVITLIAIACSSCLFVQSVNAQKTAAKITPPATNAPAIPYGQGEDVYLTASGMAVQNDILYMTWPATPGPSPRYLVAIQITNPANPTLLGKIVINGFPQGLALTKNRAFVVNGQDLVSIDITHPEQMKITNTLRVNDDPMRGPQAVIVTPTNTAYLACRRGGVVAINIINPDHPQRLGQLKLPGFSRDIASANNQLIVAADTLGFHIINLPEKSGEFTDIKPAQITTHRFPKGTFSSIHVVDNEYFFTAGQLDFASFLPDAREDHPNWPRVKQVTHGDESSFYGKYAHQMAIYDNKNAKPLDPRRLAPTRIALIANGEAGLSVFNISLGEQIDYIPQPPSRGQSSSAALLAVNVITHQQHAFVIDQNHGLRVYDLANSAHPNRLENSVNLKP